MAKPKLRQCGTTDDGRPVVAGIFFYVDTVGVPLDVCILDCQRKGFVVALDTYVADAQHAGWSDRKIGSELREAIRIVWPSLDHDAMVSRLLPDAVTPV